MDAQTLTKPGSGHDIRDQYLVPSEWMAAPNPSFGQFSKTLKDHDSQGKGDLVATLLTSPLKVPGVQNGRTEMGEMGKQAARGGWLPKVT